MIACKFKF